MSHRFRVLPGSNYYHYQVPGTGTTSTWYYLVVFALTNKKREPTWKEIDRVVSVRRLY